MMDAVIWLAALVVLGFAMRSLRHRRTHVGSASAGTIYDWLNEDKRKAVTIVVEGRAEQRDLEHADDTVDDVDDGSDATAGGHDATVRRAQGDPS